MASDLFKQQGDAPHIKELSYSVHDVLPGTERTMDMGDWHGAAAVSSVPHTDAKPPPPPPARVTSAS